LLFTEAEREDARKPVIGQKPPDRHDGKFTAKCLRLNNNQISDVKILKDFISKKFTTAAAAQIGWIDLSFNALSTVDPVSKTLYCTTMQIHSK
jgi:hypothetical protein